MKSKGVVNFRRSIALALAFLFITTSASMAAGPIIPNGFFFESPYSMSSARANFELVHLDNPPDGVLIMNQYRVDVNLFQNLLGLYAKFPFAGVVGFGATDEDDYDFGNIAIGAKGVLINDELFILTAGLELVLPTAGDNLGALAGVAYFRDMPYFLEDATTISPFLIAAVGRDWWALQGMIQGDIITNADGLEGDDGEFRLKYGITASATPNLDFPFTTSFILEVMMISSMTFNEDQTEVFITPGLRLGGKIISVGAGIQIPAGEEVDDFANVNYFMDLIIRFGS